MLLGTINGHSTWILPQWVYCKKVNLIITSVAMDISNGT